jgi:cytidylate kinase
MSDFPCLVRSASSHGQAVMLVTGIQAAGKSTVAQLLAERLPHSVHVRGDLFRRMIINGRADMTPDPSDEAVRQLRLRYQLAATVSDAYFQAGFTVILQDVILGGHLTEMTALIRSRPLLVIALAPQAAAIAEREKGRSKTAYGAGPSTSSTTCSGTRHPDSDSGSTPPARPQPRPLTRSSAAPGQTPGSPTRSCDKGSVQTVAISDSTREHSASDLRPARASALSVGLRQTQPPQQDCAMLAGRPFLVCAGGPLP